MPEIQSLPPRRQQHPNLWEPAALRLCQISQQRQKARCLTRPRRREVQDVSQARPLMIEQVYDPLHGRGVQPVFGEVTVGELVD